MRISVVLLLIAISAEARDMRPLWVHHARDLIGETKGVRKDALNKLKGRFKTFDDLVPELSGEFRHYALDVAVAIKFPEAADKLLEQLDTDRDGSITLAVNALLDEKNHIKIGQKYVEYLQSHPLNAAPTPVLMAMSDFFTHQRRPLPDDLYERLLTHSRVEVQQSAALYFSVTGDKREIVIHKAATLHPQVRAQVMMSLYDQKEFAQAEQMCKEDQDAILQSACTGLKFQPEKRAKKSSKLKKKKKSKK